MGNLILTRKLGERIKIGDDVWVTLVKIDGGQVRLGIEAPDHTHITREELLPPGEMHHSRTDRSRQ